MLDMRAFVKYDNTILDSVDFERQDKHLLLKSISDNIDKLLDGLYNHPEVDLEVVYHIHISRFPVNGEICFDFTPEY